MNEVPVIAPIPLVNPLTTISFTHSGLDKIAQFSVAFNLNLNDANNVCGSAGSGRVPKSQTIEPVAPKAGSKYKLFGVGFGENKIVLDKLPGTKLAVNGIGSTIL